MTKHYFTLINFILVTAAVYFSVTVFYKIVTPQLEYFDLSFVSGKDDPSYKEDTHFPISFYRTICDRNLFGASIKERKEDIVDDVNVDTLRQTELKLKLLGTVTGDKENAYAVIEGENGKEQNLYRAGDKIQNATVRMVLREKVVLSVNGKDEILNIEKPDGNQKAGHTFKRMRREGQKRKVTLKSSQIENAVNDVSQLLKQVRIRPHFENGMPDGYRLAGIKPDSIFKKMGLRNGDIVVGYDGKKIESMDDAMNLYDNLKSSSGAQLQVKRNGRIETIEYNIE